MSRFDHMRCGYSEFATGCDDWGCLAHRIDFSARKGWDASLLQTRLATLLVSAAEDALVSIDEHRSAGLPLDRAGGATKP